MHWRREARVDLQWALRNEDLVLLARAGLQSVERDDAVGERQQVALDRGGGVRRYAAVTSKVGKRFRSELSRPVR